jgi:uncharacterized protein (TIGR00369 family)
MPVDDYPALAAMEAVPIFGELGYRFTDAGEGWAEITFEAGQKSQNLYGIVHGGAWLFLADSVMGGALGTVCPIDDQIITTQFDFRWLRALKGPTIRARGTVLRRGRTVSHCTVELFDASGTQIGAGSGTYVIVHPNPAAERLNG